MGAQQNRQHFPRTAQLVDAFRSAFGQNQITVLWCEENGRQAGSRSLLDPKKAVIPHIPAITRQPQVLNRNTDPIPNGAVYIGRPGKWGNPYLIGQDGTRRQVIEKYRSWLLAKPKLLAEAKQELRGKDLVCHCAPKACHGDVLLELANQPQP